LNSLKDYLNPYLSITWLFKNSGGSKLIRVPAARDMTGIWTG